MIPNSVTQVIAMQAQAAGCLKTLDRSNSLVAVWNDVDRPGVLSHLIALTVFQVY